MGPDRCLRAWSSLQTRRQTLLDLPFSLPFDLWWVQKSVSSSGGWTWFLLCLPCVGAFLPTHRKFSTISVDFEVRMSVPSRQPVGIQDALSDHPLPYLRQSNQWEENSTIFHHHGLEQEGQALQQTWWTSSARSLKNTSSSVTALSPGDRVI